MPSKVSLLHYGKAETNKEAIRESLGCKVRPEVEAAHNEPSTDESKPWGQMSGHA